jgi:UrcA family protein
MKTSIRLGLLTAVLGLLTGAATAAAPPEQLPAIHVNFADLNLDHPAGAAALYVRIMRAARAVCESPGLRDLAAVQRADKCINEAIARAVAQVDAPLVTSANSETGDVRGD